MSDKSVRASGERRAEVAQQLGLKADEVEVWENVDGEYAKTKDGHRLLLLERGAVAWYGDKAPNPTYPLVVPSVELDESDEPVELELVLVGEQGPEIITPEQLARLQPATPPPGGADGVKPPPKHGAGSGKDAWAAYAAEHQVEVPEGATREQIIQALAEAGVPTE